jgi:hypothetical protein
MAYGADPLNQSRFAFEEVERVMALPRDGHNEILRRTGLMQREMSCT